MNRVIVAGSRSFDDYAALEITLNTFLSGMSEVQIISGRAPGADSLGEHYAHNHGIELALFPADWKKHGRAAGHIRNAEMAENATHLIAFWDGKSRGTSNMIEAAKKRGIVVRVVRFTPRSSSSNVRE